MAFLFGSAAIIYLIATGYISTFLIYSAPLYITVIITIYVILSFLSNIMASFSYLGRLLSYPLPVATKTPPSKIETFVTLLGLILGIILGILPIFFSSMLTPYAALSILGYIIFAVMRVGITASLFNRIVAIFYAEHKSLADKNRIENERSWMKIFLLFGLIVSVILCILYKPIELLQSIISLAPYAKSVILIIFGTVNLNNTVILNIFAYVIFILCIVSLFTSFGDYFSRMINYFFYYKKADNEALKHALEAIKNHGVNNDKKNADVSNSTIPEFNQDIQNKKNNKDELKFYDFITHIKKTNSKDITQYILYQKRTEEYMGCAYFGSIGFFCSLVYGIYIFINNPSVATFLFACLAILIITNIFAAFGYRLLRTVFGFYERIKKPSADMLGSEMNDAQGPETHSHKSNELHLIDGKEEFLYGNKNYIPPFLHKNLKLSS